MPDTFTIPAQGKNYLVKKGDMLGNISIAAYGVWAKWRVIEAANPQLNGRPPAIDGSPFIYPGDVLFIPAETEKAGQEAKIAEARVVNKPIAVFIGGKEYPAKQGRFAWALDTMASSFNADFVWNPGKDPEFDRATAKGSFADARLYLLGKLVCTGRLYTRTAHIGINEITKNCVFYSVTKDVVDTCLSANHREFNNSNLKQIVDIICNVLGFQRRFIPGDPGRPFETIEGIPVAETVGKFFEKLAAARGMFVSDDETGALVFRKIDADASPVAHIEFPGRIATDWSHTYDDTARFFRYLAVAKTADGKQMTSKAFTDEQVPAARQLIFSADNNTTDTLDAAAEWAALRLNLSANELKVPVSTWTAPDGLLWTPNTAVTVKSPVLDVPETRRMMIRGCEFEWSADSRSAVLSLVPVLKTEGGKLVMEDA